MKSFLLQLSLALISSFSLAGGVTIGNGGTGVICYNGGAPNGIKVQMLEYYELELSGRSLKLNHNLDNYKDIIIENLNRWESVAPKRVALYKQWLNDFENESLFVSNNYFTPVNDTGTIAIPFGCELATLAFQRPQEDLFPGVKRYTINSDYWNIMIPTQKAGLVMHELIYREGIVVQHKTSFPTRYFNSYLASAEPNSDEYVFIASQLPLMWGEFGGGLIIETLFYDSMGNLQKNACIQSNGITEDCYFNAIFGNITNSRLAVEFMDLTRGNEINGQITLRPDYFSIRFSKPVKIKSLTFKTETASFSANDTKTQVSKIYFDKSSQRILVE